MNLVYLMAVGAVDRRFVDAVAWCVTSLRRFGAYREAIVIVTDQTADAFPRAMRDEVLFVHADERLLREPDHRRSDHEKYLLARCRLHDLHDLTPYDTVMYIDCDVLAIRDINPLFECAGSFRYSREFQLMSGPSFNGCLTDEELERARWVRGINSGIFAVPAADFAGCMARWRAVIDTTPHAVSYDQAALNALILRREIRARPLPALAVAYPVLPDFENHFRPQTRFLHYCGPRERKFARMRDHYDDLMTGRPLRTRFADPHPFFSPPPAPSGDGQRARPLAIAFNDDGSGIESYAIVNRYWSRELRQRGHRIVPIGEPTDFVIHHNYSVPFHDELPPLPGKKIAVRTSDFGPFPRRWAEVVNRCYDQLWVHSAWIRQHAEAGGVDPARVRVIPHGIDPAVFEPRGAPYAVPTRKRFRFLFVGGTVIRKGIDILLEAYGRAFAPTDDVCLVIKDHPNNLFYRDGTWRTRIEAWMADRALPEIALIGAHLSPMELASLYRACQAAVFPYRAEGFVMPALEALSCGTPTVIPSLGPCPEFCTAETSFIVPARRVRLPLHRTFRMHLGFEMEVSEVDLCEIKPDTLAAHLRAVYETPAEVLVAKGRAGAMAAHSSFTWGHTADRIEACLRELSGAT